MKLDFFNLKGFDSSLVGVDIGTYAVKIVGMRIAPRPSVWLSSVITLPKVYDDEYISNAIQKAIRESNVSVKNAVLTFADESVVIRRIDIPHVAANEIPDALKWQAKDSIPGDADKAGIDYELVGEIQKEDGSKFMELLFVAVPRDLIDRKVRVLKGAGLSVIAISEITFGVEHIIKMSDEVQEGKTVLAVDIGYKKTQVSIFKSRALAFVRTIPFGSGSISEAMTSNITVNDKPLEISRDEAEDIKRRVGISYEEMTLDKGIASIQILSLMRPVLERLSKEIRRSIDYYIQEYGGEDVAAVYLVGGGSRLKNLDRYLSEELNIPTRRMEMPKSVDTSRADISPGDYASIIPLAGITMGHKDHPNLLPHEYKVEKIEFIEKISLRMAAVAAALVLLASFLLLKIGLADYRQRLVNIKFQRDILNQVEDLQGKVTEREAFLAKVEALEPPAKHIMKELSHMVPPNIVLDSVTIDRRADTMELKGIVYAPKGIAENILTKFMEDLEESGHFKDAQLVSVQGTKVAREEVSSFEMSCSLE